MNMSLLMLNANDYIRITGITPKVLSLTKILVSLIMATVNRIAKRAMHV